MPRRFSLPRWGVPLVLLAVTLAAYGLFAAQQGYYWDDWGFAWVSAFRGLEGLSAYFSVARPVWANIFYLTTSLIGASPLAAQVFALTMRWLAAVALWWMLRLVWPRSPRLTFTAALLALVYPGFSQHSIAIVYGNYSLIFGLFFVSLGLSLLSMRAPRFGWLMTLGGVALSALNLFSMEYYYGLEFLRPVLMWIAVGEALPDKRERLKRVAISYLPYGLVLIVFTVWRVFFFHAKLYQVQADILSVQMLADALRGLVAATLSAWSSVFRLPPLAEMGTRLTWLYIAVTLASLAGLAFLGTRVLPENEPREATRRPFAEWFAVGALAVLLAGIPFYAAGLEIKLQFPFDRFTQPFALGCGLLLAAALESLPKESWRASGAALLAALAIGMQIQFAFAFREEWKSQKAFFWQLTWRAPALKQGTVIASEILPFRFTDDDALTFPTNWTYDPDYRQGDLSYGQIILSKQLGETLPSLRPGLPVEWRLLSVNFTSSTDSMILVQFEPPSCLRVLDPRYDSDLPLAPRSKEMTDTLLKMGFPLLRRGAAAALSFSRVDQIAAADSSARPPEVIFGAEPAHGWCYYFERADLARQNGDWAEAARLGDEAFAVPYLPADLSEYLPFIEAYARLGRLDEARKLTLETANAMPALNPALCAAWQRVAEETVLTDTEMDLISDVQSRLEYCPMK